MNKMDKWWKSLSFREKFYVWKYYESKKKLNLMGLKEK